MEFVLETHSFLFCLKLLVYYSIYNKVSFFFISKSFSKHKQPRRVILLYTYIHVYEFTKSSF